MESTQVIVKLQEWASPLGSRGIAQCQTSTAYIKQVPIYMATVDPSKHSDTAIRLSTYDDHMIRKHYLRTSDLHHTAYDHATCVHDAADTTHTTRRGHNAFHPFFYVVHVHKPTTHPADRTFRITHAHMLTRTALAHSTTPPEVERQRGSTIQFR